MELCYTEMGFNLKAGWLVVTDRERFIALMEYKPLDRVPNHELGVWPQTAERWATEGVPAGAMDYDWFSREEYLGLDRREFIWVNFDMIPLFEPEVIECTDRYEVVRNSHGIVTRALLEGTVRGGRMCMDTYLEFPVKDLEDFRKLKKRYIAGLDERYPPRWREELVPQWQKRDYVLVLGRNCQAAGFYWRAREWMGTENLSYAWYDQPQLCHEMMEFFADFTIENARPILEQIDVEYFNLNEDFAMKTGPLLSPETFRRFIYPHLKRLVEFFKGHGVQYVTLDSDGNIEPLIPLLMDAGIDAIWPLERAANMDPCRLRREFGKKLRLWGGVDKRVIARGRKAIEDHLRELVPLIEDGGFIPTVDHTVPPDVSWENFEYYMECKRKILEGRF
ncbi:MAG: uroporphyrinogen decarboxylase family protein [Armatimonadota bacterium]